MSLAEILLEIVVPVLTLVAGGGWFVTYKAYKKGQMGEATQKEAEGWFKQQEVYQRTIDDLKESCEYIKQDRNLLREENDQLRKENNELREKINTMDNQIFELKKEIARLGRRVESLNKETKKTKG